MMRVGILNFSWFLGATNSILAIKNDVSFWRCCCYLIDVICWIGKDLFLFLLVLTWMLIFFSKCYFCIYSNDNMHFYWSIFKFTNSLLCHLCFVIEYIQWLFISGIALSVLKFPILKKCFYFSAENFYPSFTSCVFSFTSWKTVLVSVASLKNSDWLFSWIVASFENW